MNQIVTQPKPQLMQVMADKYALSTDEFTKTVRATCGLSTATPEQFAAFVIVAKQYNLNPITKEIYAFPGRSGGVVPIVSIDGWVNLVNSHGQCDGFEFEMHHDEDQKLVACTCKMWRKDRKHPVEVTEYLEECVRSTEPWKMKHRMLRHKALIQAARYAFGFAGVYDEDEARNIIENEPKDVTPKPTRAPSPAEVEDDHGSDKYRPGDEVKVQGEVLPPEPKAKGKDKKSTEPDPRVDNDGYIMWAIQHIKSFQDPGELETWFNGEAKKHENFMFPPDWLDLVEAYNAKQRELNPEG